MLEQHIHIDNAHIIVPYNLQKVWCKPPLYFVAASKTVRDTFIISFNPTHKSHHSLYNQKIPNTTSSHICVTTVHTMLFFIKLYMDVFIDPANIFSKECQIHIQSNRIGCSRVNVEIRELSPNVNRESRVSFLIM